MGVNLLQLTKECQVSVPVRCIGMAESDNLKIKEIKGTVEAMLVETNIEITGLKLSSTNSYNQYVLRMDKK